MNGRKIQNDTDRQNVRKRMEGAEGTRHNDTERGIGRGKKNRKQGRERERERGREGVS